MSTSGLGAEPPRRLRGRRRREWEARAAQDAAAQAFARMDGLQRELRARFAVGGAGGTAPPVGWAELDAETDAEAARYLEVQDRHPVAAEVGKSELLAAAVALRQAAFGCASQAERLADFAQRNAS
jgi:hypothetical protein